MNDLEVRKAGSADRLPIYRMLELYQHDLSDIWDQDLDSHGEYGYALDRYWAKSECHPFVALVGGRYAVFALVANAVKVGTAGHWMDQFFILKKYRRRGVGVASAGRWRRGSLLRRPRTRPGASGHMDGPVRSSFMCGLLGCLLRRRASPQAQ